MPKSTTPEPKSWAEAIQRYSNEKHTAPQYPESSIKDAQQRRRYRDARYVADKEKRDVNTVLQTYVDPTREQMERQRESKEQEKQREQAVLRSESHRIAAHDWNIVSNTESHGKPYLEEGLISMQKKKRVSHRAITNRDYNIVNNAAKQDAPPPKIAVTKLNRQLVEAREFSIISNQYRKDHTTRTRQDEDALRSRLKQKFWSTMHYDPVRVTFVHPEEEKRFQEARLQQQAQHGHTILSRLPTCIKASEGMLYNITTGEVRDSVQLQQREEKQQQSLEKRRTQWHVDRQIRLRDIDYEDHANILSQHRVHPERYRVQQERGYNIITNDT